MFEKFASSINIASDPIYDGLVGIFYITKKKPSFVSVVRSKAYMSAFSLFVVWNVHSCVEFEKQKRYKCLMYL